MTQILYITVPASKLLSRNVLIQFTGTYRTRL